VSAGARAPRAPALGRGRARPRRARPRRARRPWGVSAPARAGGRSRRPARPLPRSLSAFGFEFDPAANAWVLDGAPTVKVGELVIAEAARRAAGGKLSLDMLHASIAAQLRAFAAAWAARAPSLRVGDGAAAAARVAAAARGGDRAALCKFCLRAGQPDASLPCAECGLAACGPCGWRAHMTACARCLGVHCASCLHASGALAPCRKCKLLVCHAACVGAGGPAPCACE